MQKMRQDLIKKSILLVLLFYIFVAELALLERVSKSYPYEISLVLLFSFLLTLPLIGFLLIRSKLKFLEKGGIKKWIFLYILTGIFVWISLSISEVLYFVLVDSQYYGDMYIPFLMSSFAAILITPLYFLLFILSDSIVRAEKGSCKVIRITMICFGLFSLFSFLYLFQGYRECGFEGCGNADSLSEKAVESGDPAICDRAPKDWTDGYSPSIFENDNLFITPSDAYIASYSSCVTEYATKVGDPLICENIGDNYSLNRCITNSYDNPEKMVCEDFGTENNQYVCNFVKAEVTNNIEYCHKLDYDDLDGMGRGSYTPNHCYFRIAVETQDTTVCDYLTNRYDHPRMDDVDQNRYRGVIDFCRGELHHFVSSDL